VDQDHSEEEEVKTIEMTHNQFFTEEPVEAETISEEEKEVVTEAIAIESLIDQKDQFFRRLLHHKL
jgi:hypothetical protein